MPFLAFDTDGKTAYSSDGITWDAAVQAIPALNYPRVSHFDGLWIVPSANNGAVYISPDALTWTEHTGLGANSVREVQSDRAGLWVAACNGSEVYSSTDGENWTFRKMLAASNNQCVGYGDGLWVIGDSSGAIYTSTDLTTWTKRLSFQDGYGVQSVVYGGGVWVAVGENGLVYSSPDGITWTQRTSQFGSTIINGAAYGAGLFVIVGFSGKLSTSPDGQTWTARTGGHGSSSIYQVAWDDRRFVTCGASGKVAYSDDGIIWTGMTTGLNIIAGLGAEQVLIPTAILDATLEPLTGDLAGWVNVQGDLTATLEVLTGDFAGHAQVNGALNTTLAPLAATLAGEVAYAGPLVSHLAPLTGTLSATFTLAVVATRGDRTLYRLRLTGAPDVVLPMSSFQARRRDNQPTYLACVIPNGKAYADAITDNSTGELVVDMTVIAGDSETTSELVRAALEDIRLDEGARSASATLTGYKIVATATPKIVTVHDVSYRHSRNGKRRLRCEVNFDLNPGDTVQDGQARWVAREISYAIGPALSLMEVAE